MWWQFFAQNVHFGINLFAALVCMGICWLYLDAWSNRHATKELFKWVGFGALGLSFLFQSTIIEQSVLGGSVLGHLTAALVIGARMLGYAAIIIGQVIDPLQTVPKNKGIVFDGADPVIKKTPAVFGSLGLAAKWLLPAGGFTVAVLYWRRATIGLEHHLKPIAKAFLLFAISDFIALASLLRSTSSPVLYTWVAAFGWVWWVGQLTLLAGVIVLGFWTWSYLLERFFSQLFMIFTGMIVVVFLVVSVSFTGLLLRNIRSDSLTNLGTAANVLGYALNAKQSETTSAALQLSGSTDITAAIVARDRTKLASMTSTYLVDKKLSGLVVTNESGQVLLRGQDNERWGDSVSADVLVKRALLGLDQSSIGVTNGVSAPVVQVRSAVAVKDASGNVVGSIITSLDLDASFVDGIKRSTGLQSSIYGGKTLATTTLVGSDGKTRPVGVKLSDKKVTTAVLDKGNSFVGPVNLQNRQMLAAFLPIKDVDNAPVGMLLVAEPQSAILLTAGHSVELTLLMTAVLLLTSVLPIYYIVKSLTKQLA